MAQAVRIHRAGGPEVMQLESLALPPPGPGQVTVCNHVIGLNQRYARADVAQAQRDLVARRTTGSTIIAPPALD